MIKFAIRRPTKKIHRNYTPVNPEKKRFNSWLRRFSLKILWSIFIIFGLIYGGFLLLKNSIFDHQYVIKRVLYSSGDTQQYDNPYLYKRISNWIKDENYYIVRTYKSRILEDVQQAYPLVTDIAIDYASSNTVLVKLTFRPIDLIIRNQATTYLVVGSTILPLYSGNKIANGALIVDLPEYLSGVTSLSGFFYKQSATGLFQQVQLIYQWFPWLHHIEYLPGGERTIVYIDGKKLYINNLSDITNQIRNYELLKKYYKDYAQLEHIDLGSLETDKLIVKKF